MSGDREEGWFTAATAIVLEGLLLSCVMTLPFLLVSGYVAGLLSVAAVWIWWWIRRLMADPNALEEPARKTGFWSPAGLLEGSAVVAAFGALALGLAAMMRWGYDDSVDAEILGWLRWPGFPIPVLLFAVSAIMLGLSLWRRRASTEASPHRVIAATPVWIGTFTDNGATIAYMTVALVTTGFYVILTTMYDGDGPDALEFLRHAPIIALAIPMAGLMTAARLRTKLATREANPGDPASGRHVTVWRVGAVIRLACFAPATAALVYSLHLINVVISSSLPAMTTATATGQEVHDWIVARHDDGATIADIADELNQHGRETDLTGDDGLFGLLPEPANRDFGSIRRNDCRVSLQAGIADSGDIETIALRMRKDRPISSEAPKASGPIHVKYCLKISCPSLASWDREPMWTVYSSHPSSNPEWIHFYRIRPFFKSEQPNSGGYCTETGELADSYQG